MTELETPRPFGDFIFHVLMADPLYMDLTEMLTNPNLSKEEVRVVYNQQCLRYWALYASPNPQELIQEALLLFAEEV